MATPFRCKQYALITMQLHARKLTRTACAVMAVAGIGHGPVALACLLELEPVSVDSQQALLQSMPFSVTRAFLLLRMTANALLVSGSIPAYLLQFSCLVHVPLKAIIVFELHPT